MSFGLVTVQQVKWHLGAQDEFENPELEFMILNASGIILDYLKIYDPDVTSPRSHNDFWDLWKDPDQVPFPVKAATLLAISELREKREAGNTNIISPAIKSLLARWRDPAIA